MASSVRFSYQKNIAAKPWTGLVLTLLSGGFTVIVSTSLRTRKIACSVDGHSSSKSGQFGAGDRPN